MLFRSHTRSPSAVGRLSGRARARIDAGTRARRPAHRTRRIRRRARSTNERDRRTGSTTTIDEKAATTTATTTTIATPSPFATHATKRACAPPPSPNSHRTCATPPIDASSATGGDGSDSGSTTPRTKTHPTRHNEYISPHQNHQTMAAPCPEDTFGESCTPCPAGTSTGGQTGQATCAFSTVVEIGRAHV